jgi:phosphoserine aminotransferase
VAKLVLEWLKNEIGGLEKMKEINEKKAGILYDFLDNSKMFRGTVVAEDRSLMNIPFVTGNEELDALFVKEAAAAAGMAKPVASQVHYVDLSNGDNAVVYATEEPSVLNKVAASLHHGISAVVEYFN